MRILGQYDSNGVFCAFVTPLVVYVYGNYLRDIDGFVVAVKDSYGDFVSPRLLQHGVKSKFEIELEASHG